MADPSTSSEVQIDVTHGPYAGRRLTVSDKDGKQAISEGWAVDPFAEPKEPKELSDEDRQKLLDKAEAGARRLRGEEEPSATSTKEAKAVEAEKPAEYQTRDVKAKGDK